MTFSSILSLVLPDRSRRRSTKILYFVINTCTYAGVINTIKFILKEMRRRSFNGGSGWADYNVSRYREYFYRNYVSETLNITKTQMKPNHIFREFNDIIANSY